MGTELTDGITPLLTSQEITLRVQEMGAAIARDYADRSLVIVCVLKGSFVFAADLVRAIPLPLRVEFLGVRSYGAGTHRAAWCRSPTIAAPYRRGRRALGRRHRRYGPHRCALARTLTHPPAAQHQGVLASAQARSLVHPGAHRISRLYHRRPIRGWLWSRSRGNSRNLPFIGVVD